MIFLVQNLDCQGAPQADVGTFVNLANSAFAKQSSQWKCPQIEARFDLAGTARIASRKNLIDRERGPAFGAHDRGGGLIRDLKIFSAALLISAVPAWLELTEFDGMFGI